MHEYYDDYNAYTAINKARFIVFGILLNLICVTGIIGNILSLIVLKCREFKRSTTTVYLQGLLCIDCLYLLTNLIYQGFIHGLDFGEWYIGTFGSYSKAYLEYCIIDIFRNTSVLLTMAVTSDRYIYVCHSFRAANLCTEKRSRIVILCLLLLVVIYEIPRFFIHKVIEYPQSMLGCKPVYLLQKGPLSAYPDVIEALNISGIVLFLIIPLVVIIVLTLFLLRAVKKSLSFRESMHQNYNQAHRNETQTAKPHKPEERNTTIILLSVIISFIICSLPNTVITFIREIGGNWEVQLLKLGPNIWLNLSKLLLNINSASNFLLFCFFGRKFRGVFKEIFFHCRWSHRSRRAFTIMNQTLHTQISSLNLSARGLGSRSSTMSKSDYSKLETKYGTAGGRKPTPFIRQENMISTSFDGESAPVIQSTESVEENDQNGNEMSRSLLKSLKDGVSDAAC